MLYKPASWKTNEDIVREWDAIAVQRLDQIDSGRDSSFTNILAPMMLRAVSEGVQSSVLDLGCGSGTLTEMMAERATRVTGVDPSSKNIELATQHHSPPNVNYVCATAEAFNNEMSVGFDVVVANMVLMDVVDLAGFLGAAFRNLNPGGRFFATIANPDLWPEYWGYESAPWFDRRSETPIEGPFVISEERSKLVTTHIHRPVRSYREAFAAIGFEETNIVELLAPSLSSLDNDVPEMLPRFLFISAVRSGFEPGV
ncbi:methyltransferase domain-containing protein [Arthrobacter sp. zg-Y859]|uniref:Methyltransferase domain-containing protein n=1 Tax=Arthrobacter jinronghuae TaxID=2964609 RepID=A0ABT1NQT3_9MICC|nr:methyltransferase domain-containing protein [Arthrobacter jinronghuae]MCQ1949967.1 methyltransferase domain-containing protein [Arthrobacter jinronghuae]UWX80295.1 methyltransferase domain-containing protein [Arthrobacter jinronghuae]